MLVVLEALIDILAESCVMAAGTRLGFEDVGVVEAAGSIHGWRAGA